VPITGVCSISLQWLDRIYVGRTLHDAFAPCWFPPRRWLSSHSPWQPWHSMYILQAYSYCCPALRGSHEVDWLHCTQKFKFHSIREPAHSFNSFRIQLSINDVYTHRHMILYTFTFCQLLSHIIYIVPQRTLGIALDVLNSSLPTTTTTTTTSSPPWSFLEHQTWQLHPGSMGIMAKYPCELW